MRDEVFVAHHSSDNVVERDLYCLDVCQKCGEEGTGETSSRMESADEREFVSPLIRTFAVGDNNYDHVNGRQ